MKIHTIKDINSRQVKNSNAHLGLAAEFINIKKMSTVECGWFFRFFSAQNFNNLTKWHELDTINSMKKTHSVWLFNVVMRKEMIVFQFCKAHHIFSNREKNVLKLWKKIDVQRSRHDISSMELDCFEYMNRKFIRTRFEFVRLWGRGLFVLLVLVHL